MITVALFWPKYHGNVSSVNELALELDKERFKVIFIYLSGHGVDESCLKETGCEFFCLSDKERVGSFSCPVIFGLVRILKEHHVDILHCHRHKATVYGVMAATLAGTPVILAHVHGLDRSRNFRRRLLNFFLFKKITRIVPVANSVKQDVLKNNWRLSADKLFVLENSVDYERFAKVLVSKADAKQMLGLAPDAFVFGTVGRLVPTKGLSYLVKAFAQVKQQMPSAQLIVVGDGYLRNELEEQAVETSCADSIHFLGRRHNIPGILKGMDVFVLSSVAEGMPRAILEAMTAGVPCIATRVGGVPEILANGEFGYLVHPKDERSLAGAMIELAGETEAEKKQIIERARQRVNNCYAHDVAAKRLEKLYETSMLGIPSI